MDEKSDTGLKYVFDVSDVHRGGRGSSLPYLTKPVLVEIGKVVMEYDKTHTRNKKSVAEKLKPKRTQETQKESDSKTIIEVQETSIPKNEKEKETFLNLTTSTKNHSVLNEEEYL